MLWELSVPISPPPGRSSKRWLTTGLRVFVDEPEVDQFAGSLLTITEGLA